MDRHPGRITDIEGQPVSRFPHPFHPRDFLREHEETAQQLGMVPLKLTCVIDVHFRDDETMHWRSRIHIADREGVFVLRDLVDRRFATVHPAKKAVLHAWIVDSRALIVELIRPYYAKSYRPFTVRP